MMTNSRDHVVTALASQLRAFLLKPDARESLPEEFFRFFSYLRDERQTATYVRFLRHTMALSRHGVAGATVLDAGCGYGVTALFLAAMGAKSVTGLELIQHRVDAFNTLVSAIGLRLPVHILQSDLTNGLPVDGPFDLVLANQSISHFRDPSSFFKECARVLRPGGELLIADENNGANPRVRRNRLAYWAATETSDAAVLDGHGVGETVLTMRSKAIRHLAPQLSAAEIHSLALRTSGLWGKALEAEIRQFLGSGIQPTSVYQPGTCPVDSEGKRVEFFFDPRVLAGELACYGLDATAYAHFGASRNAAVRIINDALRTISPVTLWFAQAFRLRAVRRA